MADRSEGDDYDSRERRRRALRDKNTYEGPAALVRLGQLELDADDLVHAVNASEMDRRSASPLEPPGAGGSRAYFGACRGLAERLLVREDWKRIVDRNVPRMVNTQTKVAIIVSSGDSAVGLRGRMPRSKNEKGIVAAEVVLANEQLVFDVMKVARFRPIPPVENQTTWVLLIYSDDLGTLRAELSLPLRLDETDHFSDWTERILLDLPNFDGGLRRDVDNDEAPEIEVTVRPRA
jgi:hypothetical protein